MKLKALCLLGMIAIHTSAETYSVRGIAENKGARNLALLVGVPKNLDGIDKDLLNVKTMVTNPEYDFSVEQLWDESGNTSMISQKLTQMSADLSWYGTLFFYFSGHGMAGGILAQDRVMQISEIKEAISKGRADMPPIARLVLMFDSCFSGSLLDGLRMTPSFNLELASKNFADEVVNAFSPTDRENSNYWKNLFVFASSQSNETSDATSEGSTFTLALKKGFDETMTRKGTLGDWVSKTKEYTHRHHPVERLVPASLSSELMMLQ